MESQMRSIVTEQTLVKNGQIQKHHSSSTNLKDFLLQHTSTAYTTARSIHQKYFVDFQSHLSRLAFSYLNLKSPQQAPSPDQLAQTQETLRKLLVPSLKLGMMTHLESHPSSEMRICIIIPNSESTENIDHYILIVNLNPPPEFAKVKVAICPFTDKTFRDNPQIKDSIWVEQRQKF